MSQNEARRFEAVAAAKAQQQRRADWLAACQEIKGRLGTAPSWEALKYSIAAINAAWKNIYFYKDEEEKWLSFSYDWEHATLPEIKNKEQASLVDQLHNTGLGVPDATFKAWPRGEHAVVCDRCQGEWIARWHSGATCPSCWVVEQQRVFLTALLAKGMAPAALEAEMATGDEPEVLVSQECGFVFAPTREVVAISIMVEICYHLGSWRWEATKVAADRHIVLAEEYIGVSELSDTLMELDGVGGVVNCVD